MANMQADIQGQAKSVATFFRDARLHRELAAMKPPEAASLLKSFFASYPATACSADQLLALADLALRAKDYSVARDVLGLALNLPGRCHQAAYKLGRVEMLAGDMGAAAALFARGAAADGSFPFNWMGLARASHAMGKAGEAAEAALRFAEFGIRPHAQEEVAVLVQIADRLFESGDRRRSGSIFALVRQLGSIEPRVTVRLAEARMATEDFAGALALLRPAHEDGLLDLWGRRALAQCETLVGDPAHGLALAEAAWAERPHDEGFAATYADALIRTGDVAAWRDALARLGETLPPLIGAEIAARVALADGEVAQAGAQILSVDLRAHTRLFYLAVETGYAALERGDPTLADALAGRLMAVAPGEIGPCLLTLDVCFRQQYWERAGEALAALPPHLADRPDVLVKRFEYYCFVGNRPEAEKLASLLDSAALEGRQHALPMLRFLAEQQRWQEVVDRGIGWIGDDFSYGQIGYVLFRAVKRTRRHGEFLAAIEAIAGWKGHADLGRLHTTLAWDAAGSLAEMDRIIADLPPRTGAAMRHRMQVQRDVAARAAGGGAVRALFLCTNRNYLPATIVALHSALRQTTPGREDVFIVVDDETAPITEVFVAPFRKKGFAITVVSASEVVDAAEKLYPTYGLFTSGHTLASAAYYRIYFARHLQKSGQYTRAIYIDSDVLVRQPLDNLFALEMRGNPLCARKETPRPEVTRAIELHGLEGDLYFNSGILLFDMTHDLLPVALDDAVGAIMDDDVVLLFHDQCALNIGFRDRFTPLSIVWNLPVGESMPVSELPAEPGILHYLDRPKPWSAAYGGECSAYWFDEWREVAALLGEADAVQLFALHSD